MYKTREEIEGWLKEMGITGYTIRDDLTVDVAEWVDLSNKHLREIPVRFGKVESNFSCQNNELTSLEGSPREVGWHFYCYNNNLTSLEGCPEKVGRSFWCSNNKLVSLQYCPREVGIGWNFFCDKERKRDPEYQAWALKKKVLDNQNNSL